LYKTETTVHDFEFDNFWFQIWNHGSTNTNFYANQSIFAYWFVILDSLFLFLYFYFIFKINDPKNYIKFSKFFCDFDSLLYIFKMCKFWLNINSKNRRILTSKPTEVSLSDFSEIWICYNTWKTKGHVFFFSGGKTYLGGETTPSK